MISFIAMGLISIFNIYLMTPHGQRAISATQRRSFGLISLVVVLAIAAGWLADVRGFRFSEAPHWLVAGWALILGVEGLMNVRRASQASAHTGN